MGRRPFVFALGVLVALSLSVAVLRYIAAGAENGVPPGPGNFRVAFLVRGTATADAKLLTAGPLDLARQRIYRAELTSDQLAGKLVESRFSERRQVQWTPRSDFHPGDFEVRHEFDCTIDVPRPSAAMKRLQKLFDAAPRPGDLLQRDPGIDPNTPEMSAVARKLAGTHSAVLDQVRLLYQFVTEAIERDASTRAPASAQDCLTARRGDALAQSRLLVALLRHRSIAARVVHGLILKPGEQPSHAWVECWLGGRWLTLCPYHRHFDRLPASYLVFGHGDLVPVRGYNVTDLRHWFFVEHLPDQAARAAAADAPLTRFFHRLSLYNLPPAELGLVEFLLLLPVAALLICFFRNFVGLQSFGTFTPALLGLAFREVDAWAGAVILVAVLLIGWALRRVLDRFHLLQVPRTAVMLSLVVILLIGVVVWANEKDVALTRFLSLFPLVILTGMIERFWTLEAEDGAWTSFRTLLCTLAMAATIALVLQWSALVHFLLTYPESLGLVLAGQLWLGRYTGYRLTELWRFRDLANAGLAVKKERLGRAA